MNPTAIYSKSGKGVQEASGKTSLLKRGDRAVLSAIDGRATLADVAQKVGKSFDKDFEGLITQLDKDGFIREVSPGAAAAGAKPAGAGAKPAAKPAGKPTAPMDEASDLDFSSLATPSKSSPPPARPAAPPPPRPAAPPPKAAAPVAQQSALNKAREEAEARAAAEKDKQKAEAEAKVRAELEAKMRAEAEAKAKEAASDRGRAEAAAKLQAEADAKIKAARDAAVKAAAEAKAKADAEARRVREEADRAKREADELKQRLEAERKAREEAERKAKEAAERARKEAEEKARLAAEEERKKLEAERRKLEEERKRQEEEAAERRRREEEEAQARRAQREEEERKAEEERAARRRQREEEEQREEQEAQARRAQAEERRRQEAEAEAEAQARQAGKAADAAQAAQAAAAAQPKVAKPDSFADSLMSDLGDFMKDDKSKQKDKDDEERKAKEAKEEAKRRAREEEEQREREEEEEKARKKKEKEEAKRREKEEEERREREEEEEKARKKKEKEEAKRREKEEEEEKERKKKEKENEEREKAKAKGKKGDDDIGITDADLDTDDVKKDQRRLAKAAKASPKVKEPPRVQPPPVAGPSVRRKPKSYGKPITMVLFVLLLAGIGAVHVMPVNTGEYERAASEALGQPVKLGGGRVWLFEGSLQVRFENVTVGESVRIANVRTFPTIGALSEPRKVFNRIELAGLSLPQAALANALFARVRADNFAVERIVVRQLTLTGPLTLPKELEADLQFDATGALRAATVRGADTLVAKIAPKDERSLEFDVNAGGFTVPVAPELTLSSFGMKGVATRTGMQVEKWDGTLLNGNIAGTANVRWGNEWRIDGVFTMRGINAAVFAPALLSEGRGEGTAKFALSGAEPAKLGSSGRYDGNFTVNKGVLGSVDLSNALRTGGRQATGRTPFNEMTGQVTYNAGAVSVRNVNVSAGNLNAAISLDVAENGGLTGRIVADVRAGSQTLRQTLNLGGTAKDPQVRN